MATTLNLRTKVLPGKRIEFTAPEFNEGDIVEIQVSLPEANGSQPNSPTEPLNAWEYLRMHAGTVEAPEDWSAEHDHYLYGSPKRSGRID